MCKLETLKPYQNPTKSLREFLTKTFMKTLPKPEHAKFTQTPVKIICTEPRRIAAVSMAERVSEECGTQVSSVCLFFRKKRTSHLHLFDKTLCDHYVCFMNDCSIFWLVFLHVVRAN